MATLDRRGGLGGAADGIERRVGGVGIAERVAGHAAQAETARGVQIGGFQAAIIKYQRFGNLGLQEELAIIRAMQRVMQDGLHAVGIKLELADRIIGHDAHTPGASTHLT